MEICSLSYLTYESTVNTIRAKGRLFRLIEMTELLYLHDSYLKEVDATVLEADRGAVTLDRTVFYPGGGGQPGDTGWLSWQEKTAQVLDMRRAGEKVWHGLEAASVMPHPGAHVRAALDWNRRYAIMRYHSALHILVGAVYRLFRALVTGVAIYPDRARMDFSLYDLSRERVRAIEEETNRVIAEDRRIGIRYVTRDEFERSDLLRLARHLVPTDVEHIRVIEIEDYDAQADGGTHVTRTSEIGELRIVKTDNKGKTNRRLEIQLAQRSVQ